MFFKICRHAFCLLYSWLNHKSQIQSHCGPCYPVHFNFLFKNTTKIIISDDPHWRKRFSVLCESEKGRLILEEGMSVGMSKSNWEKLVFTISCPAVSGVGFMSVAGYGDARDEHSGSLRLWSWHKHMYCVTVISEPLLSVKISFLMWAKLLQKWHLVSRNIDIKV